MKIGSLMIPLCVFIIACQQTTTEGVKVKRNVHDFGRIKQGDSVIARYSLINKSDKNIRILNITTPCSCTQIFYDSTNIEPNDSGKFEIKYSSKNDTGSISKSFVVATSSNIDSIETFYLRGYVMH